MVIWVILTVLAAFGLLCAIWAMFGFLLPGQRGAAVVYICRGEPRDEQIIRHWGWLRELGLIRMPLLLVDGGISEEEKTRLLRCGQGVTFCTMEELPSGLEQERNRFG